MIIDFKKNPAKASCYDVLDGETGDNLNNLHVFYADDEKGLIKRYATEADGTFIVDDEGIAPLIIEESRPITISLKASHRGAISLPAGWVAAQKGQGRP